MSRRRDSSSVALLSSTSFQNICCPGAWGILCQKSGFTDRGGVAFGFRAGPAANPCLLGVANRFLVEEEVGSRYPEVAGGEEEAGDRHPEVVAEARVGTVFVPGAGGPRAAA